MATGCVMTLLFVFPREELEHLRMRIKTLIEREPAQAEPSSPFALSPEDAEDSQARAGLEEGGERDAGGAEQKGGDEGLDPEKRERERATSVIQRTWREHRERVGREAEFWKMNY